MSEIYEITDAILYRSGDVVLSNYMITLPNHFQIDFKINKSSNHIGTVNIWNTDNTAIGAGVFDIRYNNAGIGYYNGSTWNANTLTTLQSGVTTPFTFEYDNGVSTLTDGTNTVSLTQSITPTKIDVGIASQIYCKFSDVIIKPL